MTRAKIELSHFAAVAHTIRCHTTRAYSTPTQVVGFFALIVSACLAEISSVFPTGDDAGSPPPSP